MSTRLASITRSNALRVSYL